MPGFSTTKMTARELLGLGEDPGGLHLELIDGEVVVSPSPVPGHSYVEKMLAFLLLQHITSRDLGELFGDVDTIFGPHNVRRPDLIYFSKSRLYLVGEKAMEGPPDLCVEIVSPSSETIDRVDQFEQYAAAGVSHYWIVDPHRRSLEAFSLDATRYKFIARGRDDDVLRLPPFPDLEILLARLWRPKT